MQYLRYGSLGWYIVLCGYQRFGGTSWHILQFYSEDGGSMFLQNVGIFLPNYTASRLYALDLYSGYARFEPWPGHWIS
jgi:hypothetical protein